MSFQLKVLTTLPLQNDTTTIFFCTVTFVIIDTVGSRFPIQEDTIS